MLHAIKTMKPHDSEYYTEVHFHCFLCKRYSSWFVTRQVPWTEAVTSLAQNKDTQKVDSSNRCQVPASACPRGIPPWTSAILNIIRGWMPPKCAPARTMASAFWWRITVTPKSLENHRKNQEIGLLYDPFCALVMILLITFGTTGLKLKILIQ
jgi:hypothetical protein